MNTRLPRSVLLLLVVAPVARAGPLICGEAKDLLTVRRGERTVLVYQKTPNKFKAYVKELYTPAGVQVLLDSPHDHIHHHALMYAVKAETTDFWTEGNAKVSGTQRPRKAATRCTIAKDGNQATVEQTLDWVSAAGEVVLTEHRRVAVHGDAAPGATLLTWQTRLSVAKGARARLWGAHYNGLGMRFVRSMDKGGRFYNPTGKAGVVVRGDEHNLLAPWCAYTAAADGKPVTVAMFAHPKNFRGQTMWFTMTGPFSYLAATLDLHRRRHVLRADRPIDVVYGVAVWDGRIDAAAVEKLYRQWLTTAPAPKNAADLSATHVFEPTPTRYVRLLIETGEQNNANAYGRIFEIEVYSPKPTVAAAAASRAQKEPTP